MWVGFHAFYEAMKPQVRQAGGQGHRDGMQILQLMKGWRGWGLCGLRNGCSSGTGIQHCAWLLFLAVLPVFSCFSVGSEVYQRRSLRFRLQDALLGCCMPLQLATGASDGFATDSVFSDKNSENLPKRFACSGRCPWSLHCGC